MRKNEIDWIRNIGVLLLFIFHTASIFTYYEPWYVWSDSKSWLATMIYIFCIPWHMPILFFLAGASSKFSLDNRSHKGYIGERIKRLLIPFIIGMLILVPPQGYFARVSRGKPVDSFFQEWKYFWTTISNIPYDGALGPAHLWFIIYLFFISLIGLMVIKGLKKEGISKILVKLKCKLIGKYSLFFTTTIFFIADMTPLAIAQKNILIFLVVFLFGYAAYDDNECLEYIDNNKGKSLIITLIVFLIYTGVILHFYNLNNNGNIALKIILSLTRNIIMITTITTIVGYGRKYLTMGGKVLSYLNKACFPVYIIHQTVIVIIGYYMLNYNLPILASFSIIIISSVLATFVIYEIFKRIKVVRFLVGIK